MKKAVILCGGPIEDDFVFDPLWRKDTLIVCADGGLGYAKRFGVEPHAVIGDGDSLQNRADIEKFTAVYPVKKDETDSQLCLDWAIAQGAKDVVLLGGIGGRLDHEFSCYCLLLYALKKGVSVRLVNGRNEIWMTDRPFSIVPTGKKYISFFPYGGPVEGFSVKGLLYEAQDLTLTCDEVRTCSNEFVAGKTGEISFEKGNLLVMLSDDKKRS